MIGIKIADGTFYPILEEGKPGEKSIQVTTSKDEQTTVQINLYRSESGMIEDADYVDTLLIDNLIPHTSEEPTINLVLRIDEENILTAKIEDPETGTGSESSVSLDNLVSRSIFDTSDVKVIEEEPAPADIPSEVDDLASDTMMPEIPITDEMMNEGGDGLSDMDFSLGDLGDFTLPDDLPVMGESMDGFSFSTDDLDDGQFDISGITDGIEEPVIDDARSLPDDSMSLDIPEQEETQDIPAEEPDDFQISEDNDGLDDFTMNDDESPSDDFSFSTDDIDDENMMEPVAESVLSDEDFSFSTDELEEDEDEKPFSFDSLPDFDEIPELSVNMDDQSDFDFDIPEEGTTVRSSYSADEQQYDFAPSGASQGSLFGGSDLFEETRREDKRNRRKIIVPIVICTLCALISLAVLGIILYLTPSIMKLTESFSRNGETVMTATQKDQAVEAETEIIIPEETKRPVEENAIVVMKETIPPVVPENKGQSSGKVNGIIRHLVKWGDTLWDLAGFYYRNPWLYKIISDANNLKNPDLIISGTYLQIPEQ